MCHFPISTITLETKVMRVYKINILASVNRSMYNGFIPHRECNIARKILVMRAQLVRTGLLVLTVISIFLVSVITPAPVRAQTLNCINQFTPEGDPYTTNGTGSVADVSGGSIRPFDTTSGYELILSYWNGTGYTGETVLTSTATYTLTFPIYRVVSMDGDVNFELCYFIADATDTPTPTIMIEATVTPSPVPTPTPIDVALETQKLGIIAYNQFLWSIGIGAMVVGLLMLSFLRVRL